jgi:hypothetical protein
MKRYFGTYQTFNTISKKEAAVLLGSDCIVGDFYTITTEKEKGSYRAWIVNKFNQKIGYFDQDFTRQIMLLKAENLELIALLTCIAFTESADDGYYWGQVAVIGYREKDNEIFKDYLSEVSKLISNNIHPRLTLSEEGIDAIFSSQGHWVSSEREPSLPSKKGTAFVKTERSLTDKLIEQSRKKNTGCFILSWIFLLALVAFFLFLLKNMGLF